MALDFPAPAARPAYYTPKEFAVLFSYTASWAQRMAREGDIQSVRLGRKLFIPSDQIEVVMSRLLNR